MEGHAELIALQRLDETCAQLQKQVFSSRCFLDNSIIGKLFGSIGMYGKRTCPSATFLWCRE
jgi:hypothetical protein